MFIEEQAGEAQRIVEGGSRTTVITQWTWSEQPKGCPGWILINGKYTANTNHWRREPRMAAKAGLHASADRQGEPAIRTTAKPGRWPT